MIEDFTASKMARDSDKPVLLWFRQDLRLADNPALHAAMASGQPVLPVYILDDETPGAWRTGGAARWWLHHSLAALSRDLDALGVPLVLRRGDSRQVIADLVSETDAAAVYWNRCYEPFARKRDETIKAALKQDGVAARSFNSALLHEPWTVENKAGEPFRVYSAFWRACLAKGEPETPLPAPEALESAPAPKGDRLADWALLPTAPNWARRFEAAWTPGEAGARDRLTGFLDAAVNRYKAERDRPDIEATSRLSPHLHFGELGPQRLAGANSPITCSITTTPCRIIRCVRNSRTSPGTRTATRWPPGSAVALVSPSSMPACGSCGRPAGCTTGCA